MDYEYEAFEKGFMEGMAVMISVFNIDIETVREKLNIDILTSNIYEHYQIWQNTIKDNKIGREEEILMKKFIIRTRLLKETLIRYIDTLKI